MIAFITTIRHPHNANNYERVGELLAHTLDSVLSQIDDDVVVIVVHNRLPSQLVSDSRVHYVSVDFDPPTCRPGAIIRAPERFRDKGTKYAVGVACAREHGASHVMFFDADDLISNRIAGLVNGAPNHPGWYFETGYIHSVGTRSVQFVPRGFHEKNGSTSVVRTDLIGLPSAVTPGSSQEQIVAAAGPGLVDHLLGKHGYWQDHLAPSGLVMEPLPFPGAIWMIGTGENVSGNLISGRRRQRITPEITAEFALELPTVRASIRANTKLKRAQIARKIRS